LNKNILGQINSLEDHISALYQCHDY